MQSLKKFACTRFKYLKNFLEDYHNFQQAESLHAIRVEIKKIRSLLQLLKYSTRKFKAHKRFVPFRNIFRKAGAIREPEVLLKLLIRYQIKDPEPEQLSKGPALIEEFKTDVPFYIEVVKKNTKIILPEVAKVQKGKFNDYLKKRMKEVKTKLYPGFRVRELHKTRKLIKDILYLSRVGKCIKKKQIAFFTDLENAIGHLHDKQVLVDLIKRKKLADDEFLIKSFKAECVREMNGVAGLVKEFYSGKSY